MKRILVFSMALASTAAFAADFDFAPGSIPDADPTGVTLSMVIGTGVSSVNSVTFFGMTHTWIGDVTLQLVTPDNVSHDLVVRPGFPAASFGFSCDYNGDYRFIDSGADLWATATGLGSGAAVPSGDYKASTGGTGTTVSLAAIGPQAAGTWKIFGMDSAGGDVGGWQNARLNATVVPEPVSMIALGLGLAAMARRRRK